MKIMLDPGHGAGVSHNRGFVKIPNFSYCNEGDCNYYYAVSFLMPALKKYGFEVGITRKYINENPDLKTRGNMAKGYDLFISLHSNATNGAATGTEIWDSTNPKESIKPLCDKLCDAISKAIGTNNRGTKYRQNAKGQNWYGVLRYGLAKHNFIIEHAFHDNFGDCQKYVNHLKEIAEVTAKTIAEYFGISKTENVIEKIFAIIKNQELNILPSVTIAQAILESNWGKSELAKNANNLFGIKASKDWNGEIYKIKTKEFYNGKSIFVDANFRKYNSIKDSIIDHDKFFVSTPWRKNNYARVLNAKNYIEQAQALQACGYATDPMYDMKLIDLIGRYKLMDYDKKNDEPSEWAKEDWAWAKENGITDGTRPHDFCTREEVIALIRRYETKHQV